MSTAEAGHREQSLDDWLGDVSDEDWDENPAPRTEAWPAAPAYGSRPQEEPAPEHADDEMASARAGGAADARRAAIERRRLVAGGALVAILGVVAAVLVVLLRGGDATPVPPATAAAGTITAPSETEPPATQTAPATTTPSSSTSPSETTQPAGTGSGFSLPEGTKLRSGEEADPALVASLQRALTSAGYDPGPADGTYGARTVAAVVAFQQDNELDPDGVVGADTAAALNAALARG